MVLAAKEAVEEYMGSVFKIDFEKAYNCVRLSSLEFVLEKGFGIRWRKWMKGCLKSANFSIVINKKPRGRFGVITRRSFISIPILVSCQCVRKDKSIVEGVMEGFRVGGEHVFIDDTLFPLDARLKNLGNVYTILMLFSL